MGPVRNCHPGAQGELKVQRVVSLTQRRLIDPAAVIAGLPEETGPLPSVSAYDALAPSLGGDRTTERTGAKRRDAVASDEE